jgi:hypothetical protein
MGESGALALWITVCNQGTALEIYGCILESLLAMAASHDIMGAWPRRVEMVMGTWENGGRKAATPKTYP